MRRVLFGLAIAAGCRDPEVTHLQAVKAEVCECKTAKCADAAMAKVPKVATTSDHRTQQLARDMLDCVHKLYMQDQPDLDPDREQATGSGRP
ncbi:MAG: hypothetical protein WKG01_18715 [Kofleriaceae bacterium]